MLKMLKIRKKLYDETLKFLFRADKEINFKIQNLNSGLTLKIHYLHSKLYLQLCKCKSIFVTFTCTLH